jgi:hypothetical protein
MTTKLLRSLIPIVFPITGTTCQKIRIIHTQGWIVGSGLKMLNVAMFAIDRLTAVATDKTLLLEK